uniref:Defensin n=1 Tax=Nipponia nippon TaxID=128390 RepID=A0A0A0RIC6_NIPNI|nr:defensin 3 [Nipponia nippon]AIW00375.1 defensin [Nipponia nippon]
MKILYLLFPFFLLLVQGAAGSPFRCIQRGGYCSFGDCRYPARSIGRCSRFQQCCKNIWG